jgi:hypothetical protein
LEQNRETLFQARKSQYEQPRPPDRALNFRNRLVLELIGMTRANGNVLIDQAMRHRNKLGPKINWATGIRPWMALQFL